MNGPALDWVHQSRPNHAKAGSRFGAKIAATDEASGDERNQQQRIGRPRSRTAGSGKGAQDTTGTTTRKPVAFA
jgi:hypothetical protein